MWRHSLLALTLVGCGSSTPGGPDAGPPLDFTAFDQAIETFLTAQKLPGPPRWWCTGSGA